MPVSSILCQDSCRVKLFALLVPINHVIFRLLNFWFMILTWQQSLSDIDPDDLQWNNDQRTVEPESRGWCCPGLCQKHGCFQLLLSGSINIGGMGELGRHGKDSSQSSSCKSILNKLLEEGWYNSKIILKVVVFKCLIFRSLNFEITVRFCLFDLI